MPLPKDMSKCMRKVKDEFPEGRSKKKMSKKRAHKQHVAMCLQANESYTTKQLIEGMTFSKFLIVEQMPGADTSNIKGFIRSLPTYQEMMADKNVKHEALKLAKDLVKQYGEDPLDDNVKNYITDEFDDLSRQHYKGAMMGDWAGEEEYRNRRSQEHELERQSAEWEDEMGTDAETGEELPKRRRVSGARSGMDYMADEKAAKAKADIASFDDVSASEQADRLVRAKSQVASSRPERGDKRRQAREIFRQMVATAEQPAKPSAVINKIMDELGMSRQGATTYYYNAKKQYKQEQGI